jgi:hypothetical protein
MNDATNPVSETRKYHLADVMKYGVVAITAATVALGTNAVVKHNNAHDKLMGQLEQPYNDVVQAVYNREISHPEDLRIVEIPRAMFADQEADRIVPANKERGEVAKILSSQLNDQLSPRDEALVPASMIDEAQVEKDNARVFRQEARDYNHESSHQQGPGPHEVQPGLNQTASADPADDPFYQNHPNGGNLSNLMPERTPGP